MKDIEDVMSWAKIVILLTTLCFQVPDILVDLDPPPPPWSIPARSLVGVQICEGVPYPGADLDQGGPNPL